MRNEASKMKGWVKWGLISIGWTLFGLFFASQSYVVQARFNPRIEWKKTLIICLLWGYSWNAVTPIMLGLANRFPLRRGRLARSLAIHACGAAMLFLIGTVVYVAEYRLVLGPLSDARSLVQSFAGILFTEFHAGFAVYVLVVGLNQAIDYYRLYRDRELLASNLEARLVQTQLEAMRMQLHPHFLFNALNSISVLMRRDVELADRMLVQLSNLLRAMLAKNSAHEIRLQQELEVLGSFLEIEQVRFQDRLQVRMDIDPSALDSLVPQLFFQPLVENAIRHGIATRDGGGVIDIHVERDNGQVLLRVRDNGPGWDPARGELIEGIGLSNTRSRLQHLYGAGGRFEVKNAKGGGLIAAAAVPFHTEPVTAGGAKR
jgi:sensor histidine kinase YesM